MLAFGLTLFSVLAAGPPAVDRAGAAEWELLEPLIGRWTAQETATQGKGVGERTYSWILQGSYLLSENRSTFPPQQGLPAGDRHEDWAIFSYDEARNALVVREFNSEGFVNQLVLDRAASTLPRRLVFVSEASENAPPGTRLRLTYELVGDDSFREEFEARHANGTLWFRNLNAWSRSR